MYDGVSQFHYLKISHDIHGELETWICPISTVLLILLYAFFYSPFCVLVCNRECLQNTGNFLTLHSQGLLKKKKKEKKHVKPICNSENKDDVWHFFVYYEKITELTDAKFPPEMTPLS